MFNLQREAAAGFLTVMRQGVSVGMQRTRSAPGTDREVMSTHMAADLQ